MFKNALLSIPVLALWASAAQATPLMGSYSVTCTGTCTVVAVSEDAPSPFNYTLTYGTPYTVDDLLTLTPQSLPNGTHSYSFTLDANFSFSAPGSGSDLDVGTGTIDEHASVISGGGVTWADGLNGTDILLSNGDTLNVNLSDVAWDGSAPETVSAAFTLTQGRDIPVPEPWTVALFGAGILGLAGLTRRRVKAKA